MVIESNHPYRFMDLAFRDYSLGFRVGRRSEHDSMGTLRVNAGIPYSCAQEEEEIRRRSSAGSQEPACLGEVAGDAVAERVVGS
jgi:hypothetical protein